MLRVILPLFVLLGCLNGCTETRVKRYANLLEPHIDHAKKQEMTAFLGAPTSCTQGEKYECCEYRTTRGRNETIPQIHKKEPGMGPDLAPYDYFDVIHLCYDGFGVLKEWDPVVLPYE